MQCSYLRSRNASLKILTCFVFLPFTVQLAIQDKLDEMTFYWDDIKARGEERDNKLLDVLDLAEKFWYDMAALLTTIKDTQEIVRDLESPGIDPSIIKQQQEAAEVWRWFKCRKPYSTILIDE